MNAVVILVRRASLPLKYITLVNKHDENEIGFSYLRLNVTGKH